MNNITGYNSVLLWGSAVWFVVASLTAFAIVSNELPYIRTHGARYGLKVAGWTVILALGWPITLIAMEVIAIRERRRKRRRD